MSAREGSRPYVHLNCAVSADGRLAYAHGRRALLSGPEDLRRVQELRSQLDAILVGIGTVLADDPSLRVHWELLDRPRGHEPLRVVLDSTGRTPTTARVLGPPGATLVATAARCPRTFPTPVEVFRAGEDEVDLPSLLAELARRGIASLLVEGGARVLAAFLRAGLYDVLTVYTAPVVIGGTTAPPMVSGVETTGAGEAVALSLEEARPLGAGVLLRYVRGIEPDTGRAPGRRSLPL